MKTLIVFPDRNAFYKGMGVEILENYKEVLPFYKAGKKKTGVDLIEACVYGELEHEFTIAEKQIAVMITSIAFYHVWKQKYEQVTCMLAGEGIGFLSALVCSGTISLKEAIRLIQGGKASIFLIKKVPEDVLLPSTGAFASTKKELVNEIHYIFDNHVTLATYVASGKKNGFDCMLDIGPGNTIVEKMEQLEEKMFCTSIDNPEDPNYILEGFEYKKLFNPYYCSLRVLGIMTSTRNWNESTEEYKEIVTSHYQSVKEIVDKATIKLFQTGNMEISEEDLKECFDRLKAVWEQKKTPQAEIDRRMELLEQETLLPLRKQFLGSV